MQNNTFSALFVGQNIVKFKELDSTNNYLKKMLSNCEPLTEGTVIMADHQLAGRGQKDNTWFSEPGKNLTFSIYLKSSFLLASQQFSLNQAVSLGVTDCLTNYLGKDCKIKWPNDIYYKDQKIGGILIENTIRGMYLKDSVIGIGLNVNQKEFDLLNNASSLSKILQKDYNLDTLLAQLCKSIESRYLQLRGENLIKINSDYHNQLFRLGEEADYLISGEKISGTIKAVNKEGALIVESPEGLKEYNIKEIAFIL